MADSIVTQSAAAATASTGTASAGAYSGKIDTASCLAGDMFNCFVPPLMPYLQDTIAAVLIVAAYMVSLMVMLYGIGGVIAAIRGDEEWGTPRQWAMFPIDAFKGPLDFGFTGDKKYREYKRWKREIKRKYGSVSEYNQYKRWARENPDPPPRMDVRKLSNEEYRSRRKNGEFTREQNIERAAYEHKQAWGSSWKGTLDDYGKEIVDLFGKAKRSASDWGSEGGRSGRDGWF